MKFVKLLFITFLSVSLLIVVLQNTQPVETRLFFTTVTMPRAALLAFAGGIGFVLGLLVALWLARPRARARGGASPVDRAETSATE